MSIRALLAEDHALVRSGLHALLDASDEVDVVGEASNGREAVEMFGRLGPDLALIDVAMPELNGIEAVRQIRASHPNARILMLSMYEDQQYVYESLKAGANGYVLKSGAFQELLTAIRSVMSASDKTYISPALSDTLMTDYVRRAQGQQTDTDLAKLSGREREVLQLIAEGKSSAEVAELLGISVRTVDTHRHNIMSKLEIHSIAGLTKFAIRHGLCVLS